MRWSLVVLAACGGPTLAMPDAPLFVGDAPLFMFDTPLCTATCSGECTDLDTDPLHCGSCLNPCTPDRPVCNHGTCAAPLKTQAAVHFGGADLGNAVTGVAMDPFGDVFVTGTITGTVDLGGGPVTSAGGTDLFVASYTSTGTYRWAKVFGGVGVDRGAGLTYIDPDIFAIGTFSGTVTFGGTTLTSAGGTDIAVVDLDSTTGDVLAARRYGTANADVGNAISGDGLGGYAICGSFGQGTIDFGSGIVATGNAKSSGFVAAFSAGNTQWGLALGGTGATDTSECRALGHDVNSTILAAGSYTGMATFGSSPVTATGKDAFVASFAQFGTVNWAHAFGGSGDDIANALAVDGPGNIVVAGDYQGNVNFGTGVIPGAGSVDGFFVGYSNAGAFRFARHLGAATSSGVGALVALNNGDYVATGHLAGTADLGTGALAPLGLDDLFVAEMSGADARFVKRLGGVDLDEGAAIASDQGENLVIGGQFRGPVDLGTGSTIAGGAKDNGFAIVMSP